MDDLYLIGVHEDGDFLLLGGPGEGRFRLPVDDALRAALRWERPGGARSAVRAANAEPLRPRDVQAMIRAGATAQEAAERAGWTVEKVHRYEGPILAEREHVARLAGSAVLRSRTGVSFTAPTLRDRVLDRLAGREVNPEEVTWDSWRSEDGEWTVELHFEAGGRLRTASWRFSRTAMTVAALDDEARWLSEEEHGGDSPAVRHVVTSGRAHVYDIEAEGGLRPGVAPAADDAAPAHPQTPRDAEPDLITAVRQRSGVQTRRRRGPRRGTGPGPGPGPASLPGEVAEVVPLEHIDYDPETMPSPPSAHGDPDPTGPDGQPEPEALQYTEAVDPPAADAESEPATSPELTPEPATSPELPEPATSPELTPGPATSPELPEPAPAVPGTPVQRTPGQRVQPAGRQRAKGRTRKPRPGVPAWDDIVFGGPTPPAE